MGSRGCLDALWRRALHAVRAALTAECRVQAMAKEMDGGLRQQQLKEVWGPIEASS